ncbi:hypothetical protein Emag_006713 [Eimeria magna]
MPPDGAPIISLLPRVSVLDQADLESEESDQQHLLEYGSLYSWKGGEGAWFSKKREGFTSSTGFFSPSSSLEDGWRTASATTETSAAITRDRRTRQQSAQGRVKHAKSSTRLLAIAFCLAVATALVWRVTTLRKRPIAQADELQPAASPEVDSAQYQRAFTESLAEFKAAWAAAPSSTRRVFLATYLPGSNVSKEALAEVPAPFAQFIEAFTQAILPAEGLNRVEEGQGKDLELQLRTFTAVLKTAKHRLSSIDAWQYGPKGSTLPPLKDLLMEKEACVSLRDFLRMLAEESSVEEMHAGGAEQQRIPSVLADALLQEIKNSELQRQQDEEAIAPFLSLLQQLSDSEAAQQEAKPGTVPGLPLFELEKIKEIVRVYCDRRRQQSKSVRDAEWWASNFTVYGVLDEQPPSPPPPPPQCMLTQDVLLRSSSSRQQQQQQQANAAAAAFAVLSFLRKGGPLGEKRPCPFLTEIFLRSVDAFGQIVAALGFQARDDFWSCGLGSMIV